MAVACSKLPMRYTPKIITANKSRRLGANMTLTALIMSRANFSASNSTRPGAAVGLAALPVAAIVSTIVFTWLACW